MSLKIKICGMRDPGNIQEVAALKPDYFGFIFHKASPRYVGDGFDLNFFELPIKRVGVFLNHSAEEVAGLIKKYGLQVAQLHGEETSDLCKQVKELTGAEVWKVFSVDDGFSLSQLEVYKSSVDMYLLDTKSSKGGGSGISFNWNLLKGYDNHKGIVLAGGLGADNVKEAISLADSGLRIEVLDINSKVEVSPALKSKELVEEVINKVRI